MFWGNRYWQTKSHRLFKKFLKFHFMRFLNAKLLNGTVLSLVTAWSAKLSHLGLNELPHCLDWSIQLPYAPASCNGPSEWAAEKNLDSYSGGSCWTVSLGSGPDIALRASSPLNTQRETSEMPFRRCSLHIAAARRPIPFERPLASWNSSIWWKKPARRQNKQSNEISSKGNSWF